MTGEFLPEVSVIMPTYNRRDLLVESLGHFTRQSLPADRFEIIVADDGSTDDTKAVVESFADRLQMKYFYQEDQGFRAGTARNAGARMAVAPVLIFLDTGEMIGPDFLKHHLAAYADGAHRAVIGYGYGYHYVQTQDTVREMLDKLAPEEIVAKFRDDPAFFDVRHETWARTDFVLAGRPMPWLTYWSLNCSVRRDDFWAVGGFDQELLGWGPEDIELGMRLHQYGVEIVLSRDAWVVASPHERDWTSNYQDAQRNLGRMLRRHPGPVTELCWGITATTTSGALFPWEDEYDALTVWQQKVRDVDVRSEIEQALRTLGPVRKVAVMGSGGQAPDALPPWSVLIDFDDELVKRAAANSGHLGYHSMGLRLPVADKSVDAVIVTSRMSGLWGRWGDLITNELERIADTVHLVDGVGR